MCSVHNSISKQIIICLKRPAVPERQHLNENFKILYKRCKATAKCSASLNPTGRAITPSQPISSTKASDQETL